jgi:hypothetical protein
MFIPTKRGGLVFAIVLACLMLVELATRWHFHDEHDYQTHRWPMPLGFLAAAAIVQLLLKRRVPAPLAEQQDYYLSSSMDEAGNAASEPAFAFLGFFRDQDSFFLIPVRY